MLVNLACQDYSSIHLESSNSPQGLVDVGKRFLLIDFEGIVGLPQVVLAVLLSPCCSRGYFH